MSRLDPPADPLIRFATYNIRKSVGLDWRRHPERILSVIAEMHPDIVALQETDRRFGARTSSIPARLLSENCALKPVPLTDIPDRMGWHGNAVLVSGEAEILSRHTLNLPSLEPRGAVVVEIGFRGRRFRVVGLHLALLATIRRRQMAMLSAHLNGPENTLPTIILGDFNEWHRAGRNIAGLGADYTISSPGPSFHATRPTAALDRIITGPGIEIRDMGVHRSLEARVASDHLPVWADCAIAK